MTTARQAKTSLSTCVFCKIVNGKFLPRVRINLILPHLAGETPSFKLAETELSYAFLALPPVTDGHALVIPKYHAVKMHELPDEYLADALAVAKRIALVQRLENYNILQNNGRVAYQTVDHVHFHVIDKPDENTGLVVNWPPQPSKEQVDAYRAEMFARQGATGKTCL
ncbi:HIT-like protein [Butyriboletus roseoflavus]|nr:HIT-like protein [Butyriboletus roseoflavus]